MTVQQRGLCILGATGSIGHSTLDVIGRHPERYRLVAVSGNRRDAEMLSICQRFRPAYVAMVDLCAAERLQGALAQAGIHDVEVLSGPEALTRIAALPEVDDVMAAIVGAAGLLPTLAAVRAGKRVLLANKECLVMAGSLFMDAVREHQVTLLPIDSEHNAIFQCLPNRSGLRRIILTASGGPFRATPLETLASVTPEQACAHPNWSMGRKISVDSATMMNKGLEVIEAFWLFGMCTDTVDVLIHPQSIVHSMVEYQDGSVLAQMGTPDMRTPIAHALAYPERVSSGVSFLDLAARGPLTFEAPDLNRFPCLSLAYQALRQGCGAPAVLNAANEVAVQAFLDRKMGFLQIPALIEAALAAIASAGAETLEQILALDAETRQYAEGWVRSQGVPVA
ncbi:1-deoxy-D-xylulose-5-phosphate reductoisomerase [Thermithiobacillus plumbiphilus]|uniref:1-deoxy-D-xylulose 5-phosphate reductoisomerase n=1 Tax=Thermithiobacillus plumbiphilus TaxID=1729899 RepID=A0ABU9D3M2_9PROT